MTVVPPLSLAWSGALPAPCAPVWRSLGSEKPPELAPVRSWVPLHSQEAHFAHLGNRTISMGAARREPQGSKDGAAHAWHEADASFRAGFSLLHALLLLWLQCKARSGAQGASEFWYLLT